MVEAPMEVQTQARIQAYLSKEDLFLLKQITEDLVTPRSFLEVIRRLVPVKYASRPYKNAAREARRQKATLDMQRHLGKHSRALGRLRSLITTLETTQKIVNGPSSWPVGPVPFLVVHSRGAIPSAWGAQLTTKDVPDDQVEVLDAEYMPLRKDAVQPLSDPRVVKRSPFDPPWKDKKWREAHRPKGQAYSGGFKAVKGDGVKFTSGRKKEFLAAFRERLTLRPALIHVGISYNQFKYAKKTDPKFKEEYDTARGEMRELALDALVERAIWGQEIVIRDGQGNVTGTKTVFSDRLLELFLIHQHPAFMKRPEGEENEPQARLNDARDSLRRKLSALPVPRSTGPVPKRTNGTGNGHADPRLAGDMEPTRSDPTGD